MIPNVRSVVNLSLQESFLQKGMRFLAYWLRDPKARTISHRPTAVPIVSAITNSCVGCHPALHETAQTAPTVPSQMATHSNALSVFLVTACS